MPIGLQDHDPMLRFSRLTGHLFRDFYEFHGEAVSDVGGLELLTTQLGAGVPAIVNFGYDIYTGDLKGAYKSAYLAASGVVNLYAAYTGIMAYDRWAFRIGRHGSYDPMTFRDFRYGIGYFMRRAVMAAWPVWIGLLLYHDVTDIDPWDEQRDYSTPPA
jgi:hypothetical protein